MLGFPRSDDAIMPECPKDPKAANVTQRLWSMADIVALIDKAAPAPKKRGPCRKAA
jgi:hypothetical protein